MARIAGVLSDPPAAAGAADVARMLAAVAPPGGASQVEALGPAAFGAASTGGRVALAARGALLVVADGEIYNAVELVGRRAAAADVVLELIDRHGIDEALARMNGDFAFAAVDRSSGRAWLARDRFGVKPLYYHTRGARLAFASRPAALFALGGVDRRVNRAFVARFAGLHYRTFDNDPGSSPYAEVAQLPAAHLLEWHRGGIRVRAYWSIAEQPDFEGSEAALAEEYRDLLMDAVRRRVEVARAPAFTLSGGMDSSSVVACAARIAGRPQTAFSTVYRDATFDESRDIQSIVGHAVGDWRPVLVDTPDVFSLVDRMVRAHDEPVATATWLSHYLLCDAVAAAGHGALFGGLGGDELNAGEYEYFFFHFADLRQDRDETALAAEIDCWARHHDHPIYRKNAAAAYAGLARLVDGVVPGRCLVDRVRLERYRAAVNPEYFDLGSFEPVMEHPFRSHLKNRTHQDLFRETAPCCLRAEDRQTSAFGLDHFDPFFDHRLVEFMFRIPGRLKIRNGVTKVLLREATRGLLPEETRTRVKKTGWNAPAHVWFSGASLARIRDLVASRSFRERGIYDASVVERIVDEHEDTIATGAVRENHMMFLWQLVNLEAWLASLERPC